MDIIVAGLPNREAEALKHVAAGCTNKVAARQMNCSPRNVEALIETSMRRLEAANRANLITIAFQRGILKFLSVIMLVAGCGFGTITPAEASDDDQITRRLRTRITRRGTRRVNRGFYPPTVHTQLYIDTFGLQPTLSWVDGEMFVNYEPESPFQVNTTAHVFNTDDLLRWHSEQFFQSFDRGQSHE